MNPSGIKAGTSRGLLWSWEGILISTNAETFLISWLCALFSRRTSLHGASHGIFTFRELLNFGWLKLLLICIWTELYKEEVTENIIHILFSSTYFTAMFRTINFIRHCCRQNLVSLSMSSRNGSARMSKCVPLNSKSARSPHHQIDHLALR
jgi:hypothetical protein